MKKIKSNKLSLNKQTVANLNAVKGGLPEKPKKTYYFSCLWAQTRCLDSVRDE